jgi:predicted RNA-binding Zn-ribbon protein involved in translation (DUF1610 family)
MSDQIVIVKRERVVCPRCQGEGTLMSPRTREEHGSPYTCPSCNGLRVVDMVTYQRPIQSA